jgi:hypothetical protein
MKMFVQIHTLQARRWNDLIRIEARAVHRPLCPTQGLREVTPSIGTYSLVKL